MVGTKVRYVVREAIAPEPPREESGVIVEVVARNRVRVRTDGGHGIVDAINTVVPARLGLPVRVAHSGGSWRVVGLDHLALPDPGSYHYVPQHGEAHMFNASGGGDDVIWLDKIQYTPLLVAPDNPPSTVVRILPGTYFDSNGILTVLSESILVDLSPYFTSETVNMLVGINTAEHKPEVLPWDNADASQLGNVLPLAIVRLRPGATAIHWDNILDVRDIPSSIATYALGAVRRANCIVRYTSSGDVSCYSATRDGLDAALADAVAGDVIMLPYPIAGLSAVVVPDGVTVDFACSRVAVTGNGTALNFVSA